MITSQVSSDRFTFHNKHLNRELWLVNQADSFFFLQKLADSLQTFPKVGFLVHNSVYDIVLILSGNFAFRKVRPVLTIY